MQHDRNERRSPSDRTKVERGIWYRETSTGRKYVVQYVDSDRKVRWKTVDGGLREARAVRAELTAKKARGERIAPTRQTLEEFATDWLARQTQLRPKTRDGYGRQLRLWVFPRIGRRRVSDVTEEDVLDVIAAMQKAGKAGWTIHGALVPLSRVLGHGVRRRYLAANPVKRLERGERPSVGRRRDARARLVGDREAIGACAEGVSDAAGDGGLYRAEAE